MCTYRYCINMFPTNPSPICGIRNDVTGQKSNYSPHSEGILGKKGRGVTSSHMWRPRRACPGFIEPIHPRWPSKETTASHICALSAGAASQTTGSLSSASSFCQHLNPPLPPVNLSFTGQRATSQPAHPSPAWLPDPRRAEEKKPVRTMGINLERWVRGWKDRRCVLPKVMCYQTVSTDFHH